MKFLDEAIELKVSGFSAPSAGTYPYTILKGSSTIFSGNVFLKKNQTSVTIDISDIVADYKDNVNDRGFKFDVFATPETIMVFTMRLNINGTIKISNSETVAMFYRYPNYKAEMSEGIVFEPSEHNSWFKQLLQGNNVEKGRGFIQPRFIPRYPLKSTENYGIFNQILFTDNLIDSAFSVVVDGPVGLTGDSTHSFNVDDNTMEVRYSLDTLFGDCVPGGELEYEDTGVQGFDTQVRHGVWSGSTTSTSTVSFRIYQSNEHYVPLGEEVSYNILSGAFSGSFFKTLNQKFTTGKDGYTGDEPRDLFIEIVAPSKTALLRIVCDEFKYGYNNFYLNGGIATSTSGGITTFTVVISSISLGNTSLKNVEIGLKKSSASSGYDLMGYADTCPANYYVMWQDRFGSMQSQPFGLTETYSESIKSNTFNTYRNEQRVYRSEITPKWSVNSGWIEEDLYPYYESIFVSPAVFLYDTREDKLYRVIADNSSYTEKTFKNQGRQMLNINLSLTLDKKQNIIH